MIPIPVRFLFKIQFVVTLLLVVLTACAILLPGGKRTTIVASQIVLPVRDTLIITLQRITARYPSCDFVLWDITGDRLLKVGHLDTCGRYGMIYWLPSGTRFFFQNGWDLGQYVSISLFDGHNVREITEPLLNSGGLLLSPDQRYFATMSCRTSHAEVVVLSIYRTENGEPVCNVVVQGSTIMGCGSAEDRCAVPLENGSLWQFQRNTDDPVTLFQICDTDGDCLPQDTSTLIPNTYESTRYAVEAESCDSRGVCLPAEPVGYSPRRSLMQLRIRDLENGAEFVYPLPGYEVITWAWSPP